MMKTFACVLLLALALGIQAPAHCAAAGRREAAAAANATALHLRLRSHQREPRRHRTLQGHAGGSGRDAFLRALLPGCASEGHADVGPRDPARRHGGGARPRRTGQPDGDVGSGDHRDAHADQSARGNLAIARRTSPTSRSPTRTWTTTPTRTCLRDRPGWRGRPSARSCGKKATRASTARSSTNIKTSKSISLDRDEYDVFGDGTVVLKAAPGHSPGHQVLVLNLPKTGRVMIAGDLYHYPQERTLKRPPPDTEFNVAAVGGVSRDDRGVSAEDEDRDLDRARLRAQREAEEVAAVLRLKAGLKTRLYTPAPSVRSSSMVL